MESVPDTPGPQTRTAVTRRIIAHVTRGWPHLDEPIALTALTSLNSLVAVGTVLADGPPHRSQRAGFPHWAPVMGTWRRTAFRAKGA